ncbi:hypothetical protein PSTT_09453 [Puccinia striiformis]|uniref:Uncharacterized protein n=1 Tax=Puccinia striiformis TaxID=27350 RepID=A0A2S4V8C4_9BASI|nr:hypothetical protein PSTT_09453 [Puccinia striiformis]
MIHTVPRWKKDMQSTFKGGNNMALLMQSTTDFYCLQRKI